MNFPNFSPDQYIDADSLNAASAAISGTVAFGASGFSQPGLVNPGSAVFTPSGLAATINLPLPFAVMFANGILASAHGITSGADTQTYSLNFSGAVPASGAAVTAYAVAAYQQIQQNALAIVGPPPGHPDFNPNFVPFTAYQNNIDSLAVSVSTVLPNNLTNFELFRVSLASGATGIVPVTTSQAWSVPALGSSNRYSAGLTIVYEYAGNPNTHVPGSAGTGTTPPDLVWDTLDKVFWVCVTSGNAASAVWITVALQILATSTTVFVNASTGNDATANGSAALPFQTLQAARNFARGTFDLRNGVQVNFNCTGAFVSGLGANGTFAGQASNFFGEVWTFNSGSSVNVASGFCFSTGGGAALTVGALGSGVTLSAGGTGGGGTQGYGLLAQIGGTIQVGPNVTFGACAVAPIGALAGGFVTIPNSYTAGGNGQNHIHVDGAGATIQYAANAGVTVTLTGTPTYSVNFAFASHLGSIQAGGISFAGTGASGSRYGVALNAVIDTNTAGNVNYFPGTSAGAFSNGGQYN